MSYNHSTCPFFLNLKLLIIMHDKIKEILVKSISNRTVTEAELEKLEQLSVYDLLTIIIIVGRDEGNITGICEYLWSISEHYKLSGGSIHHEEGDIDL